MTLLRTPRSLNDRLVAGVGGGFGARMGLEPAVVRLAFVILTLAGGAGIALYLAAWIGLPEAETTPRDQRPIRKVFALALVVGGICMVVRETALWPGDALMWAIGLAAFGSAILWTRGEDPTAGRLARIASRLPAAPSAALAGLSRTKLVLGGVLVLGGMSIMLAANTPITTLRNVAFAVMVTVAGLGFIFGPWINQLARQLRTERRERIRSEERAEVAAHLHDSVLQTLALIQRSADKDEMSTLARTQERELRAWLYGRARTGGARMLSEALDELAGRVERMHRVAVSSVLVGDAPMDDALHALVDAAGEALTNAAKHAGVATISLYCEVDSAEATLYVRDEGRGFDADAPPREGSGIAGSIVGRIERKGGVATVRSRVDQGTEVHLVMPRKQS